MSSDSDLLQSRSRSPIVPAMNIQQLPSCGARSSAAEQSKRGERKLDFTDALTPETKKSDSAPAAVTSNDLSQRLAYYAHNIDARLSLAIGNESNTDSQKAALQAVQEQFHSMIQRLDDSFLSGTRPKHDMTIGQGLQRVMDHLATSANSVISGAKLDVSG